jgi:hypothetical protein
MRLSPTFDWYWLTASSKRDCKVDESEVSVVEDIWLRKERLVGFEYMKVGWMLSWFTVRVRLPRVLISIILLVVVVGF